MRDGWTGRLWAEAVGTYAAILEHPFLAGLTDGRPKKLCATSSSNSLRRGRVWIDEGILSAGAGEIAPRRNTLHRILFAGYRADNRQLGWR
jgi:hypothetical protein